MVRTSYNDLAAFAVVARARSFTRAAAELGISPSALSQTVRTLEERLGYRLLTRTTRSVSTTEAGERLLATVAPRLEEIDTELLALGELRDKPAGTVRITASEYAADTIVWPRLAGVLRDYPDIRLELVSDNGFVDIAAQGYDAGVRLGESVEKDMVAVRIGPDSRLLPVPRRDTSSATRRRQRRRNWSGTPVSTCASLAAARSTPGNSSRTTGRYGCGSTGS